MRHVSLEFMLTLLVCFATAVLVSPAMASATIEADLVSGTESLGRVPLGRALDRGPDRPVDLDRLSMRSHPLTGQVTLIVESVAETGDMPSADDNDYTRIDDAVQAVAVLGDGTTVRLVGFFDWTEEHAAASWALGSDGVSETDDDYSVMAPWGVADVTIHAQELGDAVIAGPGDLPDLDWETFLLMWGGTYFGWTVENLDIRGFDWSIAMFYTTGADFDGVTIANNSIDVPADVPGNYSAGLGEPWQNVAIHFAGGVNQSIVGNEIILRGLTENETSEVEEPVKSAQVGMQSNTHGGDRYDHLLIAENFVVFDGWQTEIEEWVYGIWENGHAHNSNIAVVGNAFVNGHPDNDPALNLQRAFRVTSHSSEETTVLYGDNLAVGANIAIHWIGDNYTSNPPGTVLPVEVVGNTLIDNDTGIWVRTDDPIEETAPGSNAPVGPMSKAIVRHNRLVGNAIAVRSDNAEVDAQENWWGCNDGPGEQGCDDALYNGFTGFLEVDPWLVLGLAIDDKVVDVGEDTGVTAFLEVSADLRKPNDMDFPDVDIAFDAGLGVVEPLVEASNGMAFNTYTAQEQGIGWVSSNLDNATVAVSLLVTDEGVVTVESVDESGDDPNLADNDYTRLNNLVQLVGDGVTIELVGVFDWTEPFAAISWELGSDGVPETWDDYSIAAPGNFSDVSIRADELGDAMILGPGDLPTVDWETFLMMWGGTFYGWSVENLDIRGFDWSIAMFYDSGSDFNGVSILNNSIEVPTDVPGFHGDPPVGEPWQNVAIHFAGGQGQLIAGNEIVIPGDGLGDNSNPDQVLKAASIGMQSNTHGGTSYDGLGIIDNSIRITGAQSAVPEQIYGIWENGHAHGSDIWVMDNSFINEHEGNDPELNMQRGFRVTSHSSDESSVVYSGNTVVGANIGIHWLGDNYEFQPPYYVEPVILESNTLLGNGTGVWVHTDGLEEPDGAENKVGYALSKADLRYNRIYGNTIGVRSDNAEVDAEDNWWGCNEGPGTQDCDSALLTGFTGFLDAGWWLVLDLETDESEVLLGGTVEADSYLYSNRDDVAPLAPGSLMDGTPIAFGSTGGTMDPEIVGLDGGWATSTFTAGQVVGLFDISASLDGETVANDVSVYAEADLEVSVEPVRQAVEPGGPVAVTVTVTNNGPLPVTGASVTVDFAVELSNVVWTCSGDENTVCTDMGAGTIDDLVDLPVGASVVYEATANAPDPIEGLLEITAEVVPPAGFTDPDSDNNTAVADVGMPDLFADGFELGDTTAWSNTVGLED